MKYTISTFLTATLFMFMAGVGQAQNFGGAAAIVDGDILIGQAGQSADGSSVRIYRKDASGEWTEVGQLRRPEADGSDDRFGRSLATDGEILVVGATKVNSDAGMAYVFGRAMNGEWNLISELDPGDLVAGQSYGRSVALSDDWIIVGSAGFNDARGAAYVFNRNDWSFHSRLEADSLAEGDYFGLQVAFEGNTALVAAPFQGEEDRPDGKVHIFTFNPESDIWNSRGTLLTFPGVFDGAQAGLALTADEGVIGVSAPGLSGIGGSVLYRGSNGSYGFAGVLFPFFVSQPNNNGTIGFVNGDIWVGGGTTIEYQGNGQGGFNAASVLAGGEIRGPVNAFAFGDGFAVAGAGNADGGLGRAYILEQSGGEWIVVKDIETEYQDLYPSVTGGEVRCEDGSAEGFTCHDVDMLSYLALSDIGGGRGVRMNDVWGWTDPETGREYAIAGRNNGISFVDVTDAANPRYLGDLPMHEGSNPATWRDMKVYSNHVYVVADGSGMHGMQIFDLTQLRGIEEPVMFEETAHYGNIGSAHNIVINEETGFAYAVGVQSGGETCGGGLHMINIQDPVNPTFAGCFGHEGTGNAGTGYTHDAQCLIYHGPDTEHDGKEICFGSNENSLSIADVTDKQNPMPLAVAEYPNAGYTHQGWITDDHSYFYVNDELDETSGLVEKTRTMIYDITDLDDPVLVKEHLGTEASSDHNLYIQGNLMYQSNYTSGLRVLDISDPANPVEVGYFDVAPGGENTPGFTGTWSNYPYFESGTIVVTGIESGLFMLKKRQIDI